MFWGCGFFFGKIALAEMNSGAMVLYRFLFAAARSASLPHHASPPPEPSRVAHPSPRLGPRSPAPVPLPVPRPRAHHRLARRAHGRNHARDPRRRRHALRPRTPPHSRLDRPRRLHHRSRAHRPRRNAPRLRQRPHAPRRPLRRPLPLHRPLLGAAQPAPRHAPQRRRHHRLRALLRHA